MSKPVYYINAPNTCNLCDKPFGNKMYDARIPHSSWANLCKSCFKTYGCSLGMGQGQEYTKLRKHCAPAQCVRLANLPWTSKESADTLSCSEGKCELVGRWLKTGG